VILCDTGPIVALLNRNDPAHKRCAKEAERLPITFLTTQACITEAMHLLYRDTGYLGVSFLWTMIESGSLRPGETAPSTMPRIRELMERYKDLPCDYAGRYVGCVGRRHGTASRFTLDPHFKAYRLATHEALEVIG
jgi:uncharacterized protein